MSERFRPDPTEFGRCVSHICLKIETIALSNGVSHADCSDLEALLAAIPDRARADVLAMLNDVGLNAEFDDPAMSFAARYITRLAQDIWRSRSGTEE
jgi:hypothetical protein